MRMVFVSLRTPYWDTVRFRQTSDVCIVMWNMKYSAGLRGIRSCTHRRCVCVYVCAIYQKEANATTDGWFEGKVDRPLSKSSYIACDDSVVSLRLKDGMYSTAARTMPLFACVR